MARITSIEQLRQVIPEPRASTKLKILPELDEQATEFIQTSPFVFLATVDKAVMLTTTASLWERTSTQWSGSWGEALISWCGT